LRQTPPVDKLRRHGLGGARKVVAITRPVQQRRRRGRCCTGSRREP